MIVQLLFLVLKYSQYLFLAFLIAYASFLLLSLIVGAIHLYERRQQAPVGGDVSLPPVSILVPAYNEALTIIETVESLLMLDYDCYEIIVIDDGSTDHTAKLLKERFHLEAVTCSINQRIPTRPLKAVSQKQLKHIKLTLLEKANGGKGDSLNLGINAAQYDYFLCMDADSMLQEDSLKRIAKTAAKDPSVIAVGGMVKVSQGVALAAGRIVDYHLPRQLISCAQAIEYDCAFFGVRILLDQAAGNLIISGAFGLFKKELAIAVDGYDTGTLGEDMELVMKLHFFCQNNKIPYRIGYETDAICWSQAPSRLKDLCQQRRRWFLGLYQCLKKYLQFFVSCRFKATVLISYVLYLLFELLSPFIETFGVTIIVLSLLCHQLNTTFFVSLMLLYICYCVLIALTSFLNRVYSQNNSSITFFDMVWVIYAAIYQCLVLHTVLTLVKVSSFIGYQRKKNAWGQITRDKHKAA
ncbi:TPA: glycosyltransferase family 2 protein [Streptococcus equi subsp. zooepidemicus]|nr:glycosyltransferase family 2 protein [Streptococcus equi subsp. zooepidemicus]HEL0169968.1 glycosyltransferase family 2 protein [Streptococcus equi subsp. zooepidemicus]HEL0186045.1 glycosyltransferase family 2 protein [Streptococcus equi subsp. zooepidemicus]HEL0191962.1 glycosyltransferase family 2 protein [Streptococcus equi subsp. zooepidemicus]HEL0197951.1 glycosyltransferase family 2 protein [Streptococcus equi subsp. zooepidemicus]